MLVKRREDGVIGVDRKGGLVKGLLMMGLVVKGGVGGDCCWRL